MMMRNNVTYSRHPYLGQVQGHVARMSVETQEPLTSHQSFNNHGNGGINQAQAPAQPFSQSDYFLHSQQQPFPGSQSGFNFYGSYRLQSGGEFYSKDANENTNKLNPESNPLLESNKSINSVNSTHIEPFQSLGHPKSPLQRELYSESNNSYTKTNSSQHSRSNENRTADINDANPSPLSNASLSDSEVPDNIEASHTSETENNRRKSTDSNKHQLSLDHSDKISPTSNNKNSENYYKDYLQKYANNFLHERNGQNDTSELGREIKEEKTDIETVALSPGSKENFNTANSEESPKKLKDPAEIAKLEEAVKKNLDEAIREHHSRITHPISESSPSNANQDNSDDVKPPTTPSLPSPFNTNSQADCKSLNPSPRGLPSHVRHLNFANFSPPSPSSQPLSANSTPGGFSDFPKDPRSLGLGIPPAFVHQLPPSPAIFPNDFIQRSRANTVPSAGELKRARSDSFSSLPDHQGGFAGGAKRQVDGKDIYYCHLCSYVGSSEFHFNAHMNTHFEHQCPHCDYKSRTEGRLKRHIKDFHSEENPEDFTGGRMIRNNKPKIFRCRQCEFAATDKEEYWKHARSHIKDDKCLQCPKCAFVTEYKHHLEYHLRNHFGSKPFKCNKCNYSCVNKSMLNSHMKSHTNVYQYRCQDCTYATKYCHSLKLHLSKYNHQPATVLNNDGSLPVDGAGDFDLVSKRGPPRGPRLVKHPDGMGPPGLDIGMERNLLAMHSNMARNPLSGMAAMMGAFWSNGLGQHHPHHPPPLIPVPGLGPLSIQLPGHDRAKLGQQRTSPSGRSRDMPGLPDFSPNCKFCDFASENPHILAEHVMKNHGNEHHEIFKMFGFKPDFGSSAESREESMMMHARMEHEMRLRMSEHMKTPPRASQDEGAGHSIMKDMSDFDMMRAKYGKDSRYGGESGKSSPNTPGRSNGHMSSYSHDRSNSCSPNASPNDDYRLNKMDPSSLAKTLADEIEKEAIRKRGGEIPLDLTSAKAMDNENDIEDELSPSGFKRKWENSNCEDEPHSNASPHSEENEESHNISPNNRKRSRKGKAYKLDMISIKLQEQYTDQHESAESGDMDECHDDISDEIHSPSEEMEQSENNFEKARRYNDAGVDYSDITRQLRELNGESVSPCSSPNPGASSNGKETVDSVSMFSGSMDRKKMFIKQSNSHTRENKLSSKDSGLQPSYSFTVRPDELRGQGQTSPRSQEVEDDEEGGNSEDSSDWSKYECQHCGIAFRDCIMYTMHMGYHGFQNPFTCNRCGQTTKDKVEFFLHIARKAHA